MKHRIALALALVIAFAPTLSAAEIHRWTDAQGVIHFTNKPTRPKGSPGTSHSPGASRASASGARSGIRATAPVPHNEDLSRYSRYDESIRQAAALYQIPEPLVRAVIKVESDYDPRATSRAGARGLMQLMPDTAARMQVKDITDPRENIFGGVRYLRVLANLFNGNLELTIAAYNAGEQAVVEHGGIPPYAQVRDYVVKVTSYYRRYRTMRTIDEVQK
ncbi:MAG: lytic transglycosylase domain-containing protein [Polyangiaceae bacterium]|nr:lytic transglycosylase domain-containing protein [Polyangiaceae bacterium]